MSRPAARETKHRTSAQSDTRGSRDEAAGTRPAALFFPGTCCEAAVVTDDVSTDLMDAAVYVGDGAIEVQRLPVPATGPTDVLLEVSHCGICGTDLHLVLERYARPGSVLGHEWAGTVAAVGEEVSGWEIGARVVVDSTPGCGRCRACTRGRSAVCLCREPPDLLDFSRGAFCRFKAAPAARLLRVPDDLPTRSAALTEPTAIALHSINLAQVSPDDRVLVTGGGPTKDKPDVTFASPADPKVVDHEFTIRVPDCQGAYETLRGRGAEFLTPPVDWGGEIRAFFRDPDGHLFEISQRKRDEDRPAG